MHNKSYKIQAAYIDFISQPDLEFFTTITLKRVLKNEARGFTQLRQEDVEKTAHLLRLWIEDALLGKRRRKGSRLTFICSFERGGWDGNPHLHIATSNPGGLSGEEYERKIRAVAYKLDWVHTDMDIRPITRDETGNRQGIAIYCLKQGVDALLLNATHIPRCDQGSVALN